jgi:hypothetical protein
VRRMRIEDEKTSEHSDTITQVNCWKYESGRVSTGDKFALTLAKTFRACNFGCTTEALCQSERWDQNS